MEQYVLHVTRRCNLRCRYCYETDRDTTYSVPDILKTASEIVKCNDKKYSIEFIGGEPLLALNNIIAAYQYIKENTIGKDIHFVISTNLVRLDEEVIDILRELDDIRLSVSLDGNQYMNQLRIFENQKGSYDIVTSNIKKIIELFGHDRIGIHMTMHPYNVAFLASGIRSIYDLGVRKIAVGIVESTIDIGEEFCVRYIHEMNKVSQMIFNKEMPDLIVSELFSMKPPSDQRTHVYGDDGRILYESYGRCEDDAITNKEVNAVPVHGKAQRMIEYMRGVSYSIHQNRIEDINTDRVPIDFDSFVDEKVNIIGKEDHGVHITTVNGTSVIGLGVEDNESILLSELMVNKATSLFSTANLCNGPEQIVVPMCITGKSLNKVDSIYASITNMLKDQIMAYDNYFPTIRVINRLTQFINQQGYDVFIKDTRFGVYPTITCVLRNRQNGLFKIMSHSDYVVERCIMYLLSRTPYVGFINQDLERFTKGKVVDFKSGQVNEKGEISNLFLLENLSCSWGYIEYNVRKIYLSYVWRSNVSRLHKRWV